MTEEPIMSCEKKKLTGDGTQTRSAHALLKTSSFVQTINVTNGYRNLLQAIDHAYDTLGSHE